MAGISLGQAGDTVAIGPGNLVQSQLTFGRSTYIVYNKKTKDSPAEHIYLVKILTESKLRNGRPIVAVTQQWDYDTVTHSAYTVFNAADFSTISHDYFWKRQGFSVKFDFESRRVGFTGPVPDSLRTVITRDFNASFEKYNLNWHSDLLVFSLLPYAANRVFRIHFYDPGFGKAEEEYYSVTGTDSLTGIDGNKTACWVMKLTFTSSVGYQKFWISQKDHVVLKEEDFYNHSYRYKLRTAVSEND